MGFKLVGPGDPSIEQVEIKLPVLPRDEAHRIRRASRAFADTMLPTAMRRIADALEADDPEVYKWAVNHVLRMTLAQVPNETSDPEDTVVDGTAKEIDALKALEKQTEAGTGLPDDT
jgi:hypothetical protein